MLDVALGVLDLQLTRTELADAARQCELYIGTMGGGMDQAISCLAEVRYSMVMVAHIRRLRLREHRHFAHFNHRTSINGRWYQPQ